MSKARIHTLVICPPVAESRCLNCRFFRQQEKGCDTCHRFPPCFAGDASPIESHRWKFPVVHGHGWCGEYQASAETTSGAKYPLG